MGINLGAEEDSELKPRIAVFGVGGAGGNAVNNMISKNLEGVEFIVANTDAQAIETSRANSRVQLGNGVTAGLGAGMRPEVGREAAEETLDQIIDHLGGANMCFITAGMGGGTGTGAAPVIAKAARELGVLTVGVVTKPFSFEGAQRMRLAEEGIGQLQEFVDTLIIIPNQNLFRIATENTTIMDAFNLADDVLYQGVKGVTDLMVMPGLINLDFADVRTVMSEMGKAMMGTGEAEGSTRALDAAGKAIANPLLDEVSLQGARGVLINITGGNDLTLFEVDEAANRIKEEVDPDANIIVGSCFDETLNGSMRVSVVATGIEAEGAVSRVSEDESRRKRRPFPAPTSHAPTENAKQNVTSGTRHAIHQAVGTSGQDMNVTAEMEEEDRQMVVNGGYAVGQMPNDAPTTSSATSAMPDSGVADQNINAPQGDEAQGTGIRSRIGLIRRVAGSLTGSSPAKAPVEQAPAPSTFKNESLDDEDDGDDLKIPAFLRRQAN